MILFTESTINQIPYSQETLKLKTEAESYLSGFNFCKGIKNVWFDRGWGRILTVFLMEIIPLDENVDEKLWIIVGDLPPAYIDTYSIKNGAQALECYTLLMRDWSDVVISGGDLSEMYPVNVEPTVEHAMMLRSRVEFIEREILPQFPNELNE